MAGTTQGGRKSSQGGSGNPDKASPAAIERYLAGINYPVHKEDLIRHARQNNAPSDVLSVLNRFEEKEYHSPIDVSKETAHAE